MRLPVYVPCLGQKSQHLVAQDEQRRDLTSLQPGSLHCPPAMEQFVADRKPAFSQWALEGAVACDPTSYQELFSDEIFTGLNDKDGETHNPETMSFLPPSTPRIQSNSCALEPGLAKDEPQAGWSGLLGTFPRTTDEETGLGGAWPKEQGVLRESPISTARLHPISYRMLTNASPPRQTAIFPGHHTGYAAYTHAKFMPQWITLPNAAFEAGCLSHTGQSFVNDEVNLVIYKIHPYIDNPIRYTHSRTRNRRNLLGIFEYATFNILNLTTRADFDHDLGR
ncbi:hypothetical protein BKA70DRAFT_1221607 [Coprinopsis sp. MPI-PUGE-AT-0042]|nr:hypothetical protein BKA70DRAFT_1221607 [Coprinopsis sp. MPI-PUGE-AT-0042]